MNTKEALAAYHALDAHSRAVVDAWIERAVQPAGRYNAVTRAEYERLLYPRCPYVSAAAFNGALVAAGYKPRDPDDVRYATDFKARVRPEAVKATYYRAEPPAWLPQVHALAAV